MALTGAQVRQLRSLAHHLDPVVNVGKAGVAPSVVDQANMALEAHELIKCSVQDTSGMDTRDAAHEMAEACGAEVVQVIGHRFSIYRESTRTDVEHIKLVM